MGVTLDLSSDTQVRLEAEAARRGITISQLASEFAESISTDDPLEEFIGSGASGRGDLARRHREFKAQQTSGLAAGDL